MSIADRRRAKVEEKVRPQLQAGENIDATLSFAQTGPTPWFAILTYLIFFWIRYYAFIATNQRVLVVKRSTLLGRVLDVESTYTRDQASVVEYRPPKVWGKLELQLGPSPWTLNIHRMHKQECDAFVQVLGGVKAPPPVGPPPGT
jgi:hypothetical protein